MIRIKVIFICGLYLFTFPAFSQTNFLPGYYITLNHDTVRGYIDYRLENRNHNECFFKDGMSEEAVKLSPNQIDGFVVNDIDYYERRTHKTRRGEELYGFFKVIIRGEVSLLLYRSEYYAVDKTGRMYDLSEKFVDSGGGKRKDYYRLGVIKALTRDCEELSNQLNKRYRTNDQLPDILQEYHECRGLSFYRTRKIKIGASTQWGISAAAVSSELFFKAVGFENSDFNKKVLPEFGPYLSIFLPRVGDKTRLITEVLYGQNKTYSFFTDKNVSNDFFAEYSYLRIPAYFRYTPSAFFMEGGLQGQVIVSQDLRWRVETYNEGRVNTEDRSPGSLPFQSLGFIAGAGLKFYAGNINIQTAVRFSRTIGFDAMYKPHFQRLEFNLKLGFR